MRPCDYVIESLLCIPNREAITVDFKLNEVQRLYSERATSRDIIAKARREGFSSYILAEFLVACMSEENTRAVVISHETKATQMLLDRVHFYIDTMKGPKPKLKFASRNELSFPRTHSAFYIGTAGAKQFARGDTITHLHCSEVAFWNDPKALVAGAFQAAAFAKRIVLESTSNGHNWFKQQVDKALGKRGQYSLNFFPWFALTDYSMPLDGTEVFRDDDLELLNQHGLTLEQLKWYVTKREEFMESEDDVDGLLLFHQEYPCTLEESFISTGLKYFRTINYKEMAPVRVEKDLKVFKEPEPNHRYIIGGDVGAGLGKDYSVAQVIDITVMEEVATYRSHWLDPGAFGIKLAQLGSLYNRALVVPEVNNHGILTVDVLKRNYGNVYRRQVADSRHLNKRKKVLGFLTTVRSKHHACDALRLALRRGLVIHDTTTYHELLAFEENDEGKASAPEGMFDDCVIALALACVGMQLPQPEEPVEKKIELPPSGVILPWRNLDEASEIAHKPWLLDQYYGA